MAVGGRRSGLSLFSKRFWARTDAPFSKKTDFFRFIFFGLDCGSGLGLFLQDSGLCHFFFFFEEHWTTLSFVSYRVAPQRPPSSGTDTDGDGDGREAGGLDLEDWW